METVTSPGTALAGALNMELTPAVHSLVNREATVVVLPEGATVVWEGERAGALYVLLSGLVRGFYLDEDGDEATKCFAREGEAFSSEGLRNEGPATFSIVCLEECRCIRIPYETVRRAMKADARLEEQVMRRYLTELARLEARARELLALDAKGRYEAFCTGNPALVNRVPLKFIASYIGIRPPSLSRIRKERNF